MRLGLFQNNCICLDFDFNVSGLCVPFHINGSFGNTSTITRSQLLIIRLWWLVLSLFRSLHNNSVIELSLVIQYLDLVKNRK